MSGGDKQRRLLHESGNAASDSESGDDQCVVRRGVGGVGFHIHSGLVQDQSRCAIEAECLAIAVLRGQYHAVRSIGGRQRERGSAVEREPGAVRREGDAGLHAEAGPRHRDADAPPYVAEPHCAPQVKHRFLQTILKVCEVFRGDTEPVQELCARVSSHESVSETCCVETRDSFCRGGNNHVAHRQGARCESHEVERCGATGGAPAGELSVAGATAFEEHLHALGTRRHPVGGVG